jgi:hypothetical protein
MKHCRCCEFFTGEDKNAKKNNQESAVPLQYIKSRIDAGFDLKFIAYDLGIELESLKTRISRAQKKGVW